MDERFLDPPLAVLGDALDRAAAAAAPRKKSGVGVAPTPADRAGLLAALGKTPAGTFELIDPKTRQGRVEIDWWTDPAGRRHVRVHGWRFEDAFDAEHYDEFRPTDVPPVGRVYPGSLLAVTVYGKKEQQLAACHCGAVGKPNAIAWSGLRCGPCADAEAEGRSVPPPVALYGLGGGAIGFTPDGSALVAVAEDERRLVRLNLRTGERVVSDPVKGAGLFGLGFDPDGRTVTAMFGANTLARWDTVANSLTAGKAELPFGTLLAPDGRHLVTNIGDLFDRGPRLCAIDWADPKRLVKPLHEWPDLKRGGFSRDGSKWVALTRGMAFVEIAVPSGRRTVLRENVFVDTDTWNGGLLDRVDVMAIDPDANRQLMAYDDAEHGWHPPALTNVIVPSDETAVMAQLFEDDESDPSRVYGYTPDGHWLLLGAAGGMSLFPASAGRRPVTVRGVGLGSLEPEQAALSPDGETLACVMPGGNVWLLPGRALLAAVSHTVERRGRKK